MKENAKVLAIISFQIYILSINSISPPLFIFFFFCLLNTGRNGKKNKLELRHGFAFRLGVDDQFFCRRELIYSLFSRFFASLDARRLLRFHFRPASLIPLSSRWQGKRY